LLDIGKIGISGDILTKKEDLTAEERKVLETHVSIGAQIVEPIIYPWDVSTLVYQHHERLDGSGYPERLRGDDITLEARILGLADSFVAMIVRRAYRDAHGETEVLEYLRREADRTFDHGCVNALQEALSTDAELRAQIDRFKASV
jgi:HD-GYP domain-containing protein (c-di-GMP phosphodiesterase class II)